MKEFKDRLQLTPPQRSEIERYLGCVGVLSEYAMLKMTRKIKQIEQKLEVKKYE